MANQVVQEGKTWKAYVEGGGGCEPEKATPRNPFLFSKGVTESADCKDSVVGLEQLDKHLAKDATTPSFSYIVPDACHDAPCREGAPAGLAAGDAFTSSRSAS